MASAVPMAAAAAASAPPEKTIEELQFDNLALRALPVDKEKRNFTREVSGACFSLVDPTPVTNPQLVCYSPDVLRWIELKESEVQRPDFAEYFSGNKVLPGARPAAHCYCGHQFGHFSGQLGDGATMYLGEILTSRGERVEIQFKGAGQTPYSRRADGRKVLRSSLREFLCSEANHYLGIPTTRAGTIVTSDTMVTRDIFYDGNAIDERATIITRLAPSFIRFGSFEIAKATDSITGRKGPSVGRHDIVKQLLDYVVSTFYADVVAGKETEEERYLAFFRELTRRTAVMVAKWQSVGWCHGVLNTDNMSILGITIDYGPFGFMESFDPDYICNGSDNEGRYRYSQQPEICGWNLLKLSQNFESFIPRARLREIIGLYQGFYEDAYMEINCRKLGVGLFTQGGDAASKPTSVEEKKESGAESAAAASSSSSSSVASSASDASSAASDRYADLVRSFYATLQETGADMTNSFRCLSRFRPDSSASLHETLDALVSFSASLEAKLAALAPRYPAQQMAMIAMLMQTNPQLFSQPGMEDQLAAIQEELARKERRAELGKQTQQQKEEADRVTWGKWLARYEAALREEVDAARAQGVSADAAYEHRRLVQNRANPKYLLRNWIAQEVIAAAEKGDFAPARECLERLRDPYDVDDRGELQVSGGSEGAAGGSVAQMEEAAAKAKPPPINRAEESRQEQRAHMPPPETKCRIHWNKQRPDWANKLKVT